MAESAPWGDPDELFSVTYLAGRLRRSEDWVADLCRHGVIDHVKIDGLGYRFTYKQVINAVDRFQKAHVIDVQLPDFP